jgi:curved DNA-binding protein CbpA
MTDYFALLEEPRRPWLEPEALRAKFLKLAAQAHPDKQSGMNAAEKSAANRRYAELNAAYSCLAESKSRLLHLLELELGSKPKEVQEISPPLAELFAEIATACRNTDAFLAEKDKVTSPLLQVGFFERGQEWIERLNKQQKKLNESREKLTNDLKSLDEEWIGTGADSHNAILPKLERLYRLFGYFNRWNSQIQERVVRLSL